MEKNKNKKIVLQNDDLSYNFSGLFLILIQSFLTAKTSRILKIANLSLQ